MGLKIVTPPDVEPVTLAAAKLHCRINEEVTDEDELVTALIATAREYCEDYQNRAYIAQTLEATYDCWPRFPVELPRPPLTSVESIKYYDTDDAEYIWALTEYFVDTDNNPGRVALKYGKAVPTALLRPINAVKIRYVAGGAAEGVSSRVKQAILLLVGHWYVNREAVLTGTISKEIEFAVHALLDQERVW